MVVYYYVYVRLVAKEMWSGDMAIVCMWGALQVLWVMHKLIA